MLRRYINVVVVGLLSGTMFSQSAIAVSGEAAMAVSATATPREEIKPLRKIAGDIPLPKSRSVSTRVSRSIIRTPALLPARAIKIRESSQPVKTLEAATPEEGAKLGVTPKPAFKARQKRKLRNSRSRRNSHEPRRPWVPDPSNFGYQ